MPTDPSPAECRTSEVQPPRAGSLAVAAFVVGNLWLLAAIVVFLGRTFARRAPDMVSFTSEGAWLYPLTYDAVNAFCVVMAVACFGLTVATRRMT